MKNEIERFHTIGKNKEEYEIIFFFAGHGYGGGNLGINGRLSPIKILELLRSGSDTNSKFDLTLFLDCCHSGGFPLLTNYPNINEMRIYAACSAGQQSTESIADYQDTLFPYLPPYLLSVNH